MRVPQYASRFAASLALLAFAGGCRGDSTAPDAPFDPAGTSADIAAIGESFDSPAVDAYAAAAAEISAVVGGSAGAAVRAAPSAALVGGNRAGAHGYARSLTRQYVRGGFRPSLSSIATAPIPAEYLGVTFVWDLETDRYVASDLSGAPANGVRFVLYAVDPVTRLPIEPLVPIDGHADITMTETSSSSRVHVIVISSDVTFLDYAIVVTGTSSSVTLSISGYATNGTDRVNFDLDNRVAGTSAGDLIMTLDYELIVPTRAGFRLGLKASLSGLATETPSITVDLLARGDHGTMRIKGTQTDTGGSFSVTVNGDPFATITVDAGGQATITNPNGQPLSPQELEALGQVFAMFASGFDFFENLTDPIT